MSNSSGIGSGISPSLRIGAVGFGLIAVCYGFARFAFGLFLPQIDADLTLGPFLGGIMSGGSFAGYGVAIVASVLLTERLGARAVAVMAALVAAIGMAGVALAPSPILLAIAVLVAGTSTGLVSPPMAAAVAAAVRSDRQDATNTTINAGTSAGVALSGPLALVMAGQWRMAFAIFATIALVFALAATLTLPASRGEDSMGGLPPLTGSVRRLIVASFMVGMSSTALWSFGGQLVAERFDWALTGTSLLWICLGVGGVTGAWTGDLVARFGLDCMHRAFLVLMAVSILAVGFSVTAPVLALAGGATFGAAYVILTGIYLVWGVRALPNRPAAGLMIGFLTIAVGQTVGAPVFGFLVAHLGWGVAMAGFAALAIIAVSVRAHEQIEAGHG